MLELKKELLDIVDKMDRDVEAVIVEGRRDKEALEKAGFSGRIYTCSEDTDGIVSVAREVRERHDSVAILTDFDQEGDDLYGKLRGSIPESKVRIIWRKKLGKVLTQKGRRDIESINNIME